MDAQALSPPNTISANRIRRAHQRGVQENEWLHARYSFSFADYRDPNHTHWGSLRALNDDWVAPGRGFAPHGHRDIETLTIPLSGRIRHTDSLGNDVTFGPGEVLRMSAGSGIEHAEVNASRSEPERHLQVWLYPDRRGTAPSCELVRIDEASQRDRWRVIASPDGRDGSATIQQNALVFASRLSRGASLRCALEEHRLGYLHVASGELHIEPGLLLHAGDGLRFTHHEQLAIVAGSADTDVLLFDL